MWPGESSLPSATSMVSPDLVGFRGAFADDDGSSDSFELFADDDGSSDSFELFADGNRRYRLTMLTARPVAGTWDVRTWLARLLEPVNAGPRPARAGTRGYARNDGDRTRTNLEILQAGCRAAQP